MGQAQLNFRLRLAPRSSLVNTTPQPVLRITLFGIDAPWWDQITLEEGNFDHSEYNSNHLEIGLKYRNPTCLEQGVQSGRNQSCIYFVVEFCIHLLPYLIWVWLACVLLVSWHPFVVRGIRPLTMLETISGSYDYKIFKINVRHEKQSKFNRFSDEFVSF